MNGTEIQLHKMRTDCMMGLMYVSGCVILYLFADFFHHTHTHTHKMRSVESHYPCSYMKQESPGVIKTLQSLLHRGRKSWLIILGTAAISFCHYCFSLCTQLSDFCSKSISMSPLPSETLDFTLHRFHHGHSIFTGFAAAWRAPQAYFSPDPGVNPLLASLMDYIHGKYSHIVETGFFHLNMPAIYKLQVLETSRLQ